MDLQLVSSLRCSSSNRQTSPRQNGGKWTLDRNCDFCETQDRNSGDFQFWNKWNNWKCTRQFFYINTQKFFSGKSSLGKFPMMKVWEMTTAVPEQRETFWPLSAANNNSWKAFTKTQQRPLLRVCIKVAIKYGRRWRKYNFLDDKESQPVNKFIKPQQNEKTSAAMTWKVDLAFFVALFPRLSIIISLNKCSCRRLRRPAIRL